MTQKRTVIGSGEAADMLGVSKRTVHRYVGIGLLQGEKLAGIRGAYVIDLAAVEKLLAANQKAS
jgi:predicted DNA-binding transcriptional regulator YafY